MAKEPFLNKLPFGLAIRIVSVLFYLSILRYVLAIPLVGLYGLLLCPAAGIEWGRHGKDLVVVDVESDHSREWMVKMLPLIRTRAVFLNSSARHR